MRSPKINENVGSVRPVFLASLIMAAIYEGFYWGMSKISKDVACNKKGGKDNIFLSYLSNKVLMIKVLSFILWLYHC